VVYFKVLPRHFARRDCKIMKKISHYSRLSGGESNLGLPEHEAEVPTARLRRLLVNVGSIIVRGHVCVQYR
jgi:hypothetical protein